jgi:hypothetical protein
MYQKKLLSFFKPFSRPLWAHGSLSATRPLR